MRIGFTGTQRGMSAAQKFAVEYELAKYQGGYFHHGDCIGADAEAATIARTLGYRIIGHPPVNERKRAFFPSDEEWEAEPYLVRNRQIVTATQLLIACPGEEKEVLRSGTWSTWRYAKKIRRQVVLLTP